LTARRSLGAHACAAILLVCATASTAAADGSVGGSVSPAEPGRLGPPPEKSRGFVARAPNLLKPPRAFDPLPFVVVVLEDGPVAPDARKPPRDPVRYSIVGESYAVPVFPFVTGATLEIKNEGKGSPRPYVEADPDILSGEPIAPKRLTLMKKVELAYKAMELEDHASAHLTGIVVGFPHPYFSRLAPDGSFEIKGVPAGEWTARVWYRTGWLAGASTKITVANGRETQVKLTLPTALKLEGT
jgi:hypothetical protein